jgi:translation initiation factor IF-3
MPIVLPLPRVKIRRNGELRGTPKVRVLSSSGEQLGVMTLAEALRLAMKEGLDVVEVNPKADPPICKILDLSRYKGSKPNA